MKVATRLRSRLVGRCEREQMGYIATIIIWEHTSCNRKSGRWPAGGLRSVSLAQCFISRTARNACTKLYTLPRAKTTFKVRSNRNIRYCRRI